MTEHPRNLVAWLDDELGADESTAVTQHVEACGECQARARSYAQVSGLLVESEAERRISRRWRAVAIWAGAIAATVLLCVALWPRKTPAPLLVRTDRITAPPAEVREVVVVPQAPAKRSYRRRQPARPAAPQMPYDGPVIRVAIPADALFAPGAMPAGAEIYADLVLAADGSARELRLLP